MRLLDAINYVLRGCNQGMTNSGEEESAQNVKAIIALELKQVLAPGYPFNTDLIDLQVGANGRVEVSRNYWKIRLPSSDLTWRDDPDGKRYIWSIVNNDWEDSDVIGVEVMFQLEFDRLPELFAIWVMKRATSEHWSNTNGGAPNAAKIRDANLAQAVAINSLPPFTSINRGSGYNAVVSGFGASVNVDGGWLELP